MAALRWWLLAAALSVALPAACLGQEAVDADKEQQSWQWSIAPYMWFAGIDGTIGPLPGLPAVEVDADFGDIWDQLDFAFMLAGQGLRGRIGVAWDASYLKVSADGETPGALFSTAELENEVVFGTLGLLARAAEGERTELDVLAGARGWYVSTDLDLGAGLLPARNVSDDASWVDPLVGLRLRRYLTDRLYGVLYCDVGGFGVGSDFAWQAFGGLGYEWSARVSTTLYYRHIDVDYDKDGFVWDVSLQGLLLGLTVNF